MATKYNPSTKTRHMRGYTNLAVENVGRFTYKRNDGTNCSANFPLALISIAWDGGCGFEDLADGYGPGLGTMNGDWSGIRDSSDEATAKMLERALNWIEQRVTR